MMECPDTLYAHVNLSERAFNVPRPDYFVCTGVPKKIRMRQDRTPDNTLSRPAGRLA